MNSLRDLRRQLHSIENIKKITDAMEMVAAALLRKAQVKAEQSRPYITKLKESLENLAAIADSTHFLFQQREVKKTGLVVITADRGLAGSYNTNIFSAANKFLHNYTAENVELILLGRKAVDYYKQKSWPTRHHIVNWGGKITFQEIQALSHQLLNWYVSGDFDEIWLIYTNYITIMNKKVVVEKFLNIEKPPAKKNNPILNYIFEPNPEEIIAEIIPRYCLTRIQTALYEAYASELAARIIAMRSASKNSEDLLESLTLTKNKMRQRDITREMIEITTAAEGQK